MNVLYLGQAGLGLPDRDYYLTDTFKPQLAAYRAYIRAHVHDGRLYRRGEDGRRGDGLRDRHGQGELAGRRSPRHRQDQQPDEHSPSYRPTRRASNWDAYLDGLRHHRRAIAPSSPRRRRSATSRRSMPGRRSTTLKAWQAFHVADQARAVSVEAVRRQPLHVHEDDQRRVRAAAPLEARCGVDRHDARRAARPHLRRAPTSRRRRRR